MRRDLVGTPSVIFLDLGDPVGSPSVTLLDQKGSRWHFVSNVFASEEILWAQPQENRERKQLFWAIQQNPDKVMSIAI